MDKIPAKGGSNENQITLTFRSLDHGIPAHCLRASAEQIATMTASAWTPTPRPTPTPTATPTATPIPYDLTVKVTDADGNPIAGANVAFPESGDDAPVSTDDSGQVTWSSLGGPNGALTVAAPGYFGAEQSVSLGRGPNEVVVALERDPYGLLPSVACAPEEKSLYIEDFQDGQAQGWQAITAATEFGANNGWGLGTKEEGNQVVFSRGSMRVQTTWTVTPSRTRSGASKSSGWEGRVFLP